MKQYGKFMVVGDKEPVRWQGETKVDEQFELEDYEALCLSPEDWPKGTKVVVLVPDEYYNAQ